MAKIIPFKGIRPTPDKVHLVASRAVDGYSSMDLKSKLTENPFTFLHVINPDFEDGIRTKPGSPERLQKIKKRYNEFINEHTFIQDEQPCYYIYRQQKNENVYTGIIAVCSIDDYFNGTIKKHEQTLTEREEKLKNYLEVCDFNAEPVLYCYPENKTINNEVNKYITQLPVYDFTTTDRIRHTLWLCENTSVIENEFKKMTAIYIADGHHRSASSALLGKSKRERTINYTGNEPYNYYMGVFFPDTQMRIFDFNRVVKDLNGLSTSEFLDKLKDKFEVFEVKASHFKPSRKHEFGFYSEGKWYRLVGKLNITENENPAVDLDATILTQHILSPILNIHDLKTDKRIGFINGSRGLGDLEKLVDSEKMRAGFALYPVAMEELKLIADTNNIMPPKTTYVEPKMRSGLVIYSLS